MADFVKALPVSAVPPGSIKKVILAEKPIAVANLGGTFFAIDDTCPHAGCSLSGEGFLNGKVVTCGCHGAQFDVTNGRVISLPAPSDVSSYPVKVEGNYIYISI